MRHFVIATSMLLASVGYAHADMSISFEWGKTSKCFDSKSPPITLTDVPEGTKTLDIRMIDMNSPYEHGGGKVAFKGQKSLPYGAFKYRGPCPPTTHFYQFTVKVLDANGKVLAKAKAKKPFTQQTAPPIDLPSVANRTQRMSGTVARRSPFGTETVENPTSGWDTFVPDVDGWGR